MAPESVKVTIPEPPEIVGALAPLPRAKKDEWRESYGEAFEQAAVDSPGDESAQRQAAQRAANRIFRVGKPTSYAAAASLEGWQLLSRLEQDGKLTIVTIDGAKYSFDVPARPAAEMKASGPYKGGEKKDGEKKKE